MDEKIVKDSQELAKDLVNDCISRKAAIDAICRDGVRLERGGALMITISTAKQWAVDLLCDLPSAQLEEMRETGISRYGVAAWLDNMGYTKLAYAVMDKDRFPSAQPKSYREGYQAGFNEGYQAGFKDAQPEQRWIPCSERLPSKADHTDDMVLVCYRNGSVRFNTYMNGWVQGNPVAWMPLPEPYREMSE